MIYPPARPRLPFVTPTNPAQRPKFHFTWKQIKALLATTYKEWNAVEAPRMGASLAFYTALSLAPLVLVSIAIAGLVFGREAATGALVGQIQGLIGKEGATAVQTIVQNAGSKKGTGGITAIVGFIALLFGASSVTLELRSALDKIWHAKELEGVAGFVKGRSYALAIVLGAGFLLLASLIVSAVLASVGKYFSDVFPTPSWVLQSVNALLSLVVIAGILACIFKWLPAAKIAWADVWHGAIFTAVLFTIGKTLIGIYLGQAAVGSSYGAAGSLLVVLIWIYYSAQIMFFGAEFSRVFANEFGSRPQKDTGQEPERIHPPPPQPAVQIMEPEGTFSESLAKLAGSAAGLTVFTLHLFTGDGKSKARKP